MDILFGLPVIICALILQTVVFSRLPLLNGTADVVMLVIIAWGLHDRVKAYWEWAILAGLLVSFVSAMPFLTPLVGYLMVMSLTRLLQTRVWQIPILAMILTSFTGTIIFQVFSVVVLQYINGTLLNWSESFYRVILPAALWNLLLSIPVYTLVRDMANFVYRVEEVE
jgi:rod shape-determining protein MreD